VLELELGKIQGLEEEKQKEEGFAISPSAKCDWIFILKKRRGNDRMARGGRTFDEWNRDIPTNNRKEGGKRES